MDGSRFAELPPEILIQIFQYLDFYDLHCAKLCCKQWYAVTLLPEFSSKGVFKLKSCTLNNDHPAAEVIYRKQIEHLFLKNVELSDVYKLFTHLQSSLKALTFKSLYIEPALQLTFSYFPNIQVLRISHIKLPDLIDGLTNLRIYRFKSLKELYLTKNDTVLNQYLLKVCSSYGPGLKILTVEFAYKEEDLVLKVLRAHHTTLNQIDLRFFDGCRLNNANWDVFESLKLNDLCLQGNFAKEIVIEAVKHQSKLRSLNISGSVTIENYTSHISRNLQGVQSLILACCGQITLSGLKELSKLNQLKFLEVSGCTKSTSDGICHLFDSKPNYKLKELHLQEFNIEEPDLCFCAKNLPNLNVLNLSGCGKAVTDKSIQEVFECQQKIRELKLDNCHGFTDNGLLGIETGASIQNLPNLKKLSLRGCKQLTNATLKSALRFPYLKFLDISHCELMTDEGLKYLVANCPAIEEIRISHDRNMDHEAVKILTENLSRLRLLTINKCENDNQFGAPNWVQTRFRPLLNEITLRKKYT